MSEKSDEVTEMTENTGFFNIALHERKTRINHHFRHSVTFLS